MSQSQTGREPRQSPAVANHTPGVRRRLHLPTGILGLLSVSSDDPWNGCRRGVRQCGRFAAIAIFVDYLLSIIAGSAFGVVNIITVGLLLGNVSSIGTSRSTCANGPFAGDVSEEFEKSPSPAPNRAVTS